MPLGGQIVSQDNFAKLLEPGLRKILLDAYGEKPLQFTQVFNILNSKKAIETDARMGGFGLFDEKGTLEATKYEDPTPMDTVQYKHKTFSKGYQLEKEMVDDEQYAQIQKYTKLLGRSARSTNEIHGASVFNNAFTADPNAYKGEALVSATHKRLDGGTTSNLIGALALNEVNLELAHKLANEQVDERGLKIQMQPDTLIVPRALEMTAMKIAESTLMPHAGMSGQTYAPNDINPMKGRYKIVVLDYLTDADNWFLMDSGIHELNWFWREKLNFKTTGDFDTDTARTKARMRYSYGWTSHIGILGSNP